MSTRITTSSLSDAAPGIGSLSLRVIIRGSSLRLNERLDQFYTKSNVARALYMSFCNWYDHTQFQMVDPSAGTGAFSDIMPADRIAIDKDPRGAGIIKSDYLSIEITDDRPIAVVGNPPFGQNASLAIAFFNHAAVHAKVIAFILPRSFFKYSVIRKLSPNFHLVHEELVPDHAFIAGSKSRTVPTVFQFWERRDEPRKDPKAKTTHPHFEFTSRDTAEFAIKRIGVYAGQIVGADVKVSDDSLLFVRAKVAGVEAIMRTLDFASCTGHTAGIPSLAKEEIVALYDDALKGQFGRYVRPRKPLPVGSQRCLCCTTRLRRRRP